MPAPAAASRSAPPSPCPLSSLLLLLPYCRHPGCRVVAPDLRGHGLSNSEDEADLSAATLAADVLSIWRRLFLAGAGGSAAEGGAEGGAAAAQGGGAAAGAAAAGVAAAPAPAGVPTVLVGHSMGGAIAVRAAALGLLGGEKGARFVGCAWVSERGTLHLQSVDSRPLSPVWLQQCWAGGGVLVQMVEGRQHERPRHFRMQGCRGWQGW